MKFTRTFVAAFAALSVGGAALAVAPTASADRGGHDRGHDHHHGKKCRKIDSTRQMLECVTLRGTLKHEEKFQDIADDNDDTRASGTPGFDKSARYVAKKMQKWGYRVEIQEFDFFVFEDLGGSVLQQTAPNPVTYVEDTDFVATPHSEPGEETAPVTPVDIQLGIGNTSTSGCEAADFTGFPSGNIALLQRGTCTFEIKGENAAAAGASAVLFFNQGNTAAPDRNGIPAVTLGNGYTGGIPAISATYALGAELSAVPGLVMHLEANVSRTPGTTHNVLAESRRGDRDNVIMAGAHLDSVAEGPGINDNGSGSSALLEVAEQMSKVHRPENQLRFAWWGAEEAGLVGSTFYVNDLVANDPDELEDLEMYLNFDMVASPNYGLFIYDGDGSGFGLVGPPGSDDIEALFEDFYADVEDVPSEPTAFSGRSDYQAFINNGIPSGGLFTGAEVPKTPEQVAKWGGTAGIAYDPCYHAACDDIDNLSLRALRINADAIGYVVFRYATGREVLTPTP